MQEKQLDLNKNWIYLILMNDILLYNRYETLSVIITDSVPTLSPVAQSYLTLAQT